MANGRRSGLSDPAPWTPFRHPKMCLRPPIVNRSLPFYARFAPNKLAADTRLFSNGYFALFACFCVLSSNLPASGGTFTNEQAGAGQYSRSAEEADADTTIADAATAATGIAVRSNCPKCDIDRETLKNLTLEELKVNILNKLGFTNGVLPNISNFSPITEKTLPPMGNYIGVMKPNPLRHHGHPSYYSSMEEHVRFDDSDEGVKTQFLLAQAKDAPFRPDQQNVLPVRPLLFTFDQKPKANVINATLWVYQKKLKISYNSLHQVMIHVHRTSNTGASHQIKVFEHNLTAENKWVQIDLNDAQLLEHFNNNKGNRTLQVQLLIIVQRVAANMTSDIPLITQIRKCDKNKAASSADECNNFQDPYLRLKIEEPKKRRSKRSTNIDCSIDKKVESCCRSPLTVNFSDFQWDFVIAPKSYEAYFCTGECTFLSQQRHTHTHVWMLSGAKNGSKIGPCCGPRTLLPIAMLYFNTNGNVVYGVLPGMVIERCGCQ